MEKLDQNFADFLRSLNSHGVDYLVIGGYAVGFHGFVRATGDLDVFVGVTDDQPIPDVAEVAAWKYISPSSLQQALAAHPEQYTAWLKICVDKYAEKLFSR